MLQTITTFDTDNSKQLFYVYYILLKSLCKTARNYVLNSRLPLLN